MGKRALLSKFAKISYKRKIVNLKKAHLVKGGSYPGVITTNYFLRITATECHLESKEYLDIFYPRSSTMCLFAQLDTNFISLFISFGKINKQ